MHLLRGASEIQSSLVGSVRRKQVDKQNTTNCTGKETRSKTPRTPSHAVKRFLFDILYLIKKDTQQAE